MDAVRIAAEIDRRRGGAHLLLLLDFDGTLCDFHVDPAAVRVSAEMAAALTRLARDTRISIGVVSGRRLDDVRRRLPDVSPMFIAGLHGLEITGGGETFVHEAARRAVAPLREIARRVAPALETAPGAFIEDKEFSIALHYRGAPPGTHEAVRRAMRDAASPFVDAGLLRMLPGDYVIEALPAVDWHKGRAVDWIRARVERDAGRVFTVYIGDDVTDEDAFAEVGSCGLAIAASARPGGAEFQVDGPGAVARVLDELCARLQS